MIGFSSSLVINYLLLGDNFKILYFHKLLDVYIILSNKTVYQSILLFGLCL